MVKVTVRRLLRPGRFMAGLFAVFAALLLSAAPASAEDGSRVKYYVIEEAGAPPSLSEIADRLLGSPARVDELAQLNIGRRQPDGGTVTDPDALRPGWIIVLPWDAVGPGVVFGPLPAAAGPSAAQLPAAPSTAAPADAGAASQAAASQADTAGGDAVPGTTAAKVPPHRSGTSGLLLAAVAATALMCGLLFVRRIRALRAPAGPTDPPDDGDNAGPSHAEAHGTPPGVVTQETIDLGTPLQRRVPGRSWPLAKADTTTTSAGARTHPDTDAPV
jgi:hypothetical protein